MGVIGSDFTNAEGKVFDASLDETVGAGLVMVFIDFEGPEAGSIIEKCVLATFGRFVFFAITSQNLNINLDLMNKHPFLVKLGGNLALSCSARQSAVPILLQDEINASTGYFDVVVAHQIPDNSD